MQQPRPSIIKITEDIMTSSSGITHSWRPMVAGNEANAPHNERNRQYKSRDDRDHCDHKQQFERGQSTAKQPAFCNTTHNFTRIPLWPIEAETAELCCVQ
jgi:hypothetical protein